MNIKNSVFLSCQKMSKKSSLIGLVCTVIGVILSIVVYVVTSSKLAKDQEALIKANEIAAAAGIEVEVANVWTREEGLFSYFLSHH